MGGFKAHGMGQVLALLPTPPPGLEPGTSKLTALRSAN